MKTAIQGGLATQKTLSEILTELQAGIGGGTQYTEGDTDTAITGNVLMFETDTGTSAVGVVSDSTPLPITGSVASDLVVTNALEDTAYDLNAAAYSETTSITGDYILDHIQFNFSTTESRDITVTLSDGTILYSTTSDTSSDILLEDINKAFDANDNFTVAITQTAGACSVDVLAVIKSGDSNIATVAGTIDSGNSTTTALNDGQSFTGTAVDVSRYPSVTCSVFTDTDCDMYMEYSPDGTNWDSSLSYQVSASINEIHRLSNGKKYFRLRISNDSGSNQTFMRAQTVLGSQTALNAPANLTLGLDADATVVRPTNYNYEVAINRWANSQTWNKFGYNNDVDTGSSETIWAPGGNITLLSSASTLDVVSGSSDDDGSPAGNGAQSIQIIGVDSNRDIISETVVMNGTTTVTTSGSFLGVNRVQIISSGSAEGNVGDITISATTGASIQSFIPAGESVTQQCVFFVPTGHTFLTDWLYFNINKISGGGSPRVTINGYVKSFLTNTIYQVFETIVDTDVENTVELKPSQPFVVDQEGVLYFEATTDTRDSSVAMRFSGVLVRNV